MKHFQTLKSPGLILEPVRAEDRAERSRKLAEVLRGETGIWALVGKRRSSARTSAPPVAPPQRRGGPSALDRFFETFESGFTNISHGGSAVLPSVAGTGFLAVKPAAQNEHSSTPPAQTRMLPDTQRDWVDTGEIQLEHPGLLFFVVYAFGKLYSVTKRFSRKAVA